MRCPAHTLPTLSTPASTRPSNEEAAGSWRSSATPGRVSAAVWPSPKGASVRWRRASRRDFAAEVEQNEWGGRARCWEMAAAPAPHPSKAWCSVPAMTSRQLRLCGLGVSPRTLVALASCLDFKPLWSVQVLKVSPTRRRWCRLELRCIVQAATWLVCGYMIQRSSCGTDGGKSLVFSSLRWQSAALLDKDPTSCTVWPKGVFSWQLYFEHPAKSPSHTSLCLWPNG